MTEIYNTAYVCTYWELRNDEPEVGINEDDFFQTDFLGIFSQNVFELEPIDACVAALYDKFRDNAELAVILEQPAFERLRRHVDPAEDNVGLLCFMFLYSFDYMHLVHPFMSYLLTHPAGADLSVAEYREAYEALLAATSGMTS